MIVLLDSWAWIEYVKGSVAGKKAQVYIEGDYEILTSAISIAEVAGFLLREENDTTFAIFMQQIARVFPVTAELAEEGAQLKFKHKMGLADAIILATARANGATIVTGDPDFKGMKNVVYLGK